MAAKQFGTHRLSGTVGDVTYAQTKKGFTARERTKVNLAERMTAQNFQSWRDHTAEFGVMIKEAKTFRSAFTDLNWNVKNKGLVQQTMKLMNQIRKTDTVSLRGQRRASKGDLSLLMGFDFTGNGSIETALNGGYTASFDRITGEVQVVIDAMIAGQRLAAPSSATHYMVSLAAAAINFESESISKAMVSTEKILINQDLVPATTLNAPLPPNSTDTVFIALKLEYFTELNGSTYPVMSNSSINSTVIGVDQL